ncbi:MAG: hypothetical protein IJU48_10390 [Synergistaceae bacterium]|nr:hypothetical protein [Synergistaceae bacterium]
MYEDITKGSGPKRTFATEEEYHEFLHSLYGSITDETFVEPEDAYFDYDEVPALNLEN